MVEEMNDYERLEELSDKIRKGVPVDFIEALEVIKYQTELKQSRKPLSRWRKMWSWWKK